MSHELNNRFHLKGYGSIRIFRGINAKSNLFPLCHFLNGVVAPMKSDNKLLFKSKINQSNLKKPQNRAEPIPIL